MGEPTIAVLNPLLIASVLVLSLTGAYWGRFRFPMVKPGGVADERLGRVNLVLVGVQGVLAATLTYMLGYVALFAYFVTLGIR